PLHFFLPASNPFCRSIHGAVFSSRFVADQVSVPAPARCARQSERCQCRAPAAIGRRNFFPARSSACPPASGRLQRKDFSAEFPPPPVGTIPDPAWTTTENMKAARPVNIRPRARSFARRWPARFLLRGKEIAATPAPRPFLQPRPLQKFCP